MLTKIACFLAAVAGASAFQATPALSGLKTRSAQGCSITMQADQVSRRDLFKSVAAFGLAASPLAASALVEYPGVPYLGGSDVIDVNNANIRVYTRLPGMYPNIARQIVKGVPYKSVDELFKLKTLSTEQKEVLKKYEKNLVALEPAPEYVLDNINNGLYR